MAREIIIRASIVSAELTRLASGMILNEFGGFFATEGAGGYTFADGRPEIAPAMAWHIGTAAKDSERFERVSAFARAYCEAGDQESIYLLDSDGAAYLVNADGRITPLMEPDAMPEPKPERTAADADKPPETLDARAVKIREIAESMVAADRRRGGGKYDAADVLTAAIHSA